MQHRLGHAAREIDLHGGVVLRAVGQRIDEARHLPVDAHPIVDGRTTQPGGVRDRGHVQHEIGRTAERGVADEGIVDRIVRENVARRGARGVECEQSAGRATGDVAPDFRTGRRERRVRQRQAERLGTTWLVAAVPMNWQGPPPGEPQALQPISAACSREISSRAKRVARVCTLPVSSASSASSVTPPGTRIVARSGNRRAP